MQQDSFEVNTVDIQKLVTARQVFFRKREFCVAAKKKSTAEKSTRREINVFFLKNETFTE